jgi:hypothetical protein
MLRISIYCQIIAMLVLFFAGPGASRAADLNMTDAPQSRPETPRHLRFAEGGNRACMDGCITQCRAAQQGCSGGNCREQFQICARRCVVSCGSR